ncbi:MAG: hypothetical protein IKP72_03120, partial [Clostridia bacterium]|nr:hypothetical protein [Clostridia bacterium]
MTFYGKIGTGDIFSYFHKKIKTLEKCKALKNVRFAIFAPQSGFPHLPQSLVSHPVENKTQAALAFYALHPEVMPGLSTKILDLSTCKNGERRDDAPGPPRP